MKVCLAAGSMGHSKSWSTRATPDLIFHTAVSKFKDAFRRSNHGPAGASVVVSSCEEFASFRSSASPKLAARLRQICRATDRVVLGTGREPGFVMDILPVWLTGVSREVRAVHAQRVASLNRRGPLQRKIGSGLRRRKIPAACSKKARRGHAGLKESPASSPTAWLEGEEPVGTWRRLVADHDIRTAHPGSQERPDPAAAPAALRGPWTEKSA